MTASALVTVFCDAPSCGQWEDRGIAPTAAEARAQLTASPPQWRVGVRTNGPKRLDYCPRHIDTTTPRSTP